MAPTIGELAPGCAQRCEVTYYAVAGQRAAALAVCGVVGGRALELPLSAETGEIRCARQLPEMSRNEVCNCSCNCLHEQTIERLQCGCLRQDQGMPTITPVYAD